MKQPSIKTWIRQLATTGVSLGSAIALSSLMTLSPHLNQAAIAQTKPENTLTYSQLLNKIKAGEVNRVEIDPAQKIARVKLEGENAQEIEVGLFDQNPELIETLRANRVDFEVQPSADQATVVNLMANLFLVLLVVIILATIIRRSSQATGQAMNFGKSKARFQMEAKTGVGFPDVAGIDEAKEELQEIVTFLKKPERFTAIGAKIPRGVLLIGPPGTGKTLMAKAIAGEAGVPFFSISGSEFVEMFVGVGASRVRDLFRKAKENAPCLVFIDEIDAVGRQRGTGIGGGNDEREQTLNQLLTEMDGFEGNSGIIVIAATNRPDVLDSALLRPGRFDRQIMVDLPGLKGRLGILEVHARNKKLSPEVSLDAIARRTPGFSGADLANLLNEAAILTARRRKETIGNLEIEDAIDRISIGMKLNPLLNSKQKTMTAYHEIGHALLQTLLKNADLLNKVTIIPRSGGTLGFTQKLPNEEDVGLYSRAWILDEITMALGGLAAEAEIFGNAEVTSGASSDLRYVADLTRKMVTLYGMSDLGPMSLETPGNEVFLGRDLMPRSEYSEEVAAQIDRQIRAIATNSFNQARQLLRDHRALVDHLVDLLLERETLDGEEFRQIVAQFTELPAKQRPKTIELAKSV